MVPGSASREQPSLRYGTRVCGHDVLLVTLSIQVKAADQSGTVPDQEGGIRTESHRTYIYCAGWVTVILEVQESGEDKDKKKRELH